MGPSFLSPGQSDSPSPQLPGPEPRGARPSCPRSLSCVQGNRRSWATLTAWARRDTRAPQGKDPKAVAQEPAGPGLGCGPGSGLTLWGCAPRAARPVPPPFQKHFPTGTAGFWPVGDSGFQAEWGAGRREQARGVPVWVPGLGPPTAHAAWRPSQRALCLGVPRGRRRALQAGLTGSPARVPGSQGAALVLRVALGAGVLRALGEGERTQHQEARCAGRTEGPPKPPRPREPPAPASTPVPGDTLAARACRRGWACSAGSTGSGGCRGGAGGGCRPGSRPPDRSLLKCHLLQEAFCAYTHQGALALLSFYDPVFFFFLLDIILYIYFIFVYPPYETMSSNKEGMFVLFTVIAPIQTVGAL